MCTNWLPVVVLLAISLSTALAQSGPAAPGGGEKHKTLWRIGRADGDTREFALGPDGYRDFARDAFYVVGASNPAKDWPYVQPGPIDAWAGSRAHTFTVVFCLRQSARDGGFRLVIDLVDTQPRFPPELEIVCNDRVLTRHSTPPGKSERSIEGQPDQGRRRQIAVEIAAELLNEGLNQVDIRTVSGCWLLYDAVRFDGPAEARLAAVPDACFVQSVEPLACLANHDGELRRLVMLDVVRSGAAIRAQCEVNGQRHPPIDLRTGRQDVEVYAPTVEEPTPLRITFQHRGETLMTAETTIGPVRRWVVHLLHFTHVDIGYTDYQEQVERLQMGFLDQALKLIRQTDDYPPEARFRWLPEQLWAVESYLKQADEQERRAFIEQVESGRIGLCALYGNALTGLYSEEELFALVDYAIHLRREYGVKINSAMITDVPGCTWGVVPVLAQTGIQYLSLGPNPVHRIGWTRVWDDRPFYWVSPCGRHKVLCWMSGGYGWFRSGLDRDLIRRPSRSHLLAHLEQLQQQEYPYDILQMRYDLYADNGPPDPKLSDVVKQWNEKYAYPKLVISTPSELFREFEQRYGDRLPVVRGDFTPYWEDGAASTAGDTAVNRRAAECLVQAQALWAMLDPGGYPAERVYAGWRNAVLFDEHTWGASNSISEPDSEFARQQVAYKQRFALDADAIAHTVSDAALARRRARNEFVRAVEVFNTTSWARTDLVILPNDMDLVGDIVKGADGSPVPSQRLSTGELAFIAGNIPPLGSARFTVHAGHAPGTGRVIARRTSLANGLLSVTLDEQSGAITALEAAGLPTNLVDEGSRFGLNDYVYVAGRDPNDQKRIENGSVGFSVLDRGPLVGTVQVISGAPGARKLVREIRLIDGLNRVDITNIVDKLPVREKEGVHFAFPFNVPDGNVRMDMPWAVVRPERDQIVGACKNFFAIQRWVDVSNLDYGITWATIDAPLVQLGAIRTDVEYPSGASHSWLRHIEPSQTLFSYVMNNYWETNYKADQEGSTMFRYSIRPYKGLCDQTAAARFGIERNRPLIAVPARADGPPALASVFTLDAPGVIVTSFKPSRDGRARMIRLFAASGRPESVRLTSSVQEPDVYLSDPDESRRERIDGPIELPAYGIAMLRVEAR
ncbi:MAG: polysaccharide lyase family protein [Phycisphaerae bacterium]